MSDVYTENLSDFRIREIAMLHDILDVWLRDGLPQNFCGEGVRPAFNRNSGHVFLVNGDYQVAMMNGDKLELFYTLPHSGEEGFFADLVSENHPDDLHKDDVEFILEEAERLCFDLSPPWLDVKINKILED